MRWPIQFQLLLSILLVVVVALAMALATSSYFGSRQVRRRQEDSLRRVIGTLTEANFPLTERVLQQMQGLSGAEFVLLDQKQRVRAATLALGPSELPTIRHIAADAEFEQLTGSPIVCIASHSYLSRRVPLVGRASSGNGSLAILYRKDRWQEAARQAAYPILLAGGVAAAAAVLAASVLARRFVQPLKRLGDQTAAIAAGRFRGVAVPRRNDELRDLALCINRMTEKLSRYESEVRRNERLATLGQLGAGMAHQLRNSATGARMDIELHQRECPIRDAEAQPLQVALRQLRLMESYLQRFLRLGRERPTPHEEIVLEGLLDDVLELVRPACDHSKVELRFERSAGRLAVLGDADALREVLVNLLLNALEASRRNADGPPKVVVSLEPCGEDRAIVRVLDSGPGPSPETADRLFEPFVTEKPDGTGLGLFVARQIVEAHQGTIRWDRHDRMTRFSIKLPLLLGNTNS